MQAKRFHCTNYGNCQDAAAGKLIEIAPGEPEVCPGCGRSDTLVAVKGKSPLPWVVAAGVVAACLLGGALLLRPHKPPVQSHSAVVLGPLPAGISSCRLAPVSSEQATKTFFFIKQGIGYFKAGNLNDALAEFTSAIGQDPNYLTAHANRAAAEVPLRKFREAEADLAVEKKLTDCLSEPGVTDAQLASLDQLSETPPTGNELAAAKADAMRARIKDDRIQTHYNLACVYSVEEQTGPAIDELKAAVHEGFSRKDALMTDPSLQNVRKSTDFHSVLALMP